MQRTPGTPLNDPASSHQVGDADTPEPADTPSAGSPSSAPSERGLEPPQPDPATPGEDKAGSDPSPSADVAANGGEAVHKRSWKWTVVFAGVGLLILFLDQLTKALALAHLTPGEPVNVVGSLLKFNLIRNSGAAFSLGSGYTPYISVIQITVALGVVYLSRRLGSAGWAVAFGLLFGGAVGNILDRIFREPSPFHGHVVDFLQTPHWAIFNVADMAVTSAAVLLVIQTLRGIRLDGTREQRK
jgi:signal peptidase II